MLTLALCTGCFLFGYAISGWNAYSTAGRTLEWGLWGNGEERVRKLGLVYVRRAKTYACSAYVLFAIFLIVSLYMSYKGQVRLS